MGQLVNHTSFQFNGTVVDTLSVDIAGSFLTLTDFEIFGEVSSVTFLVRQGVT
jgi:hypothetical protein